MQPQIHQFNNSDRQWLSKSLSQGHEICEHYLPQKTIDADLLDQVFALWGKQTEDKKKFSADDIANGLGSVFGELLQRKFAFSWCCIEDKYGNEPALLDEATGSIVMPINAVFKRIEPELLLQPFFTPMWQTIEAHLGK